MFSEKEGEIKSIDEKDIPKIERKKKDKNIDNDEFIGFVKVLHILMPINFPLIDNRIAEELGLFNTSSPLERKIKNFKKFHLCLDRIIEKYRIPKVQFRGIEILPYKTLDEFLFVSISKERKELLKYLKNGYYLTDEIKDCLEIAFSIHEELKQCIQNS